MLRLTEIHIHFLLHHNHTSTIRHKAAIVTTIIVFRKDFSGWPIACTTAAGGKGFFAWEVSEVTARSSGGAAFDEASFMFALFVLLEEWVRTRLSCESLVCPIAYLRGAARFCSELKAAVARVGRVQPERPAGRDVEVGDPQLDILARAQIASELHKTLAALDERLASRISTSGACRIV